MKKDNKEPIQINDENMANVSGGNVGPDVNGRDGLYSVRDNDTSELIATGLSMKNAMNLEKEWHDPNTSSKRLREIVDTYYRKM